MTKATVEEIEQFIYTDEFVKTKKLIQKALQPVKKTLHFSKEEIMEKLNAAPNVAGEAIDSVTPFLDIREEYDNMDFRYSLEAGMGFKDYEYEEMTEETKTLLLTLFLEKLREQVKEERGRWVRKPYYDEREKYLITTKAEYEANKLQYALMDLEDVYVLDDVIYEKIEELLMEDAAETIKGFSFQSLDNRYYPVEFLPEVLTVLPFGGSAMDVLTYHFREKLNAGLTTAEIERFQKFKVNPFDIEMREEKNGILLRRALIDNFETAKLLINQHSLEQLAKELLWSLKREQDEDKHTSIQHRYKEKLERRLSDVETLEQIKDLLEKNLQNATEVLQKA